ncbi:hypothetical protein EDD30_0265 [Couchioplanes caeruleus]|uniref:Uncharacterized protein n=1 Tax=Couchioplanes caeruleus TaxID=56438 RepID=A0A3N1GBI4_9ACTN|nr:hypothetical protein EDD30_0265 [Couchioplanes caeruleus]
MALAGAIERIAEIAGIGVGETDLGVVPPRRAAAVGEQRNGQ